MGSYFGAHTGKCYDLHSPYTFFAGHSPLDLVHAGLWESATQTACSLSARIAIIHLVAEARGIDMNPLTLAKLQAAGDAESSKVLEIIHADEITRKFPPGLRWICFQGPCWHTPERCDYRPSMVYLAVGLLIFYLSSIWSMSVSFLTKILTCLFFSLNIRCAKQGLDPIATFRSEVETNFRGKIKGPFNTEDRLKAVRPSRLHRPFYRCLPIGVFRILIIERSSR